MVLKTRIAPYARLDNMPGFLRSGHIFARVAVAKTIAIMPIEEVSLEVGGCISLASKRLQREEYWYKELATIYPYGLNDNVKNLSNVSKKSTENIIV